MERICSFRDQEKRQRGDLHTMIGRLSKIILVSVFFASLAFPSFSPAPVEAATFNKNKLIEDSLFTDSDSMTVSQIQNFLEDEGGTLLANWRDDVHMRSPGSGGCVVHYATNKTAAQLIYEAA